MIVLDTDAWAQADRVDRWREQFGRTVIRAEVLADGERPADFAIRMAMLGGEQVTSLSMRLRAARKIRDRSWFKDGADDLTLMLCQSGSVRYDANGTRCVLRPGEAAIFSHTVPVDLRWDEARIVTMQIPRRALAGLPDMDALAGRVISRANGARGLLAVYLAELWRQGRPLSSLAERHLLELSVEALTGTGVPAETRASRAEPRIAAIRALVKTHARSNLRIEQVSAMLGVSARTIERDLATVESSFADELVAARLEMALADLGGSARISDIAYSNGFNDLSAFNRRFKARFGRTPREERAARREQR